MSGTPTHDQRRQDVADLAPLGTWLQVAEHFAKRDHDGHLSVLRFTSGWKAVFGTPHLDHGGDYDVMWGFRHARSPEEACEDLVRRERLLTPMQRADLENAWCARAVRAEEEAQFVCAMRADAEAVRA